MSPSNRYPDFEAAVPSFLYTREYVGSLIDLFRRHNVKTILDCACGAGFPAFSLYTAGFDIMCSDPSGIMIQKLRTQIKSSYAHIPHFPLSTKELPKLGLQFNVVLCRGNALMYTDAWMKQEISDDMPQRIEQALSQMYSVLSPTGMLYLDMTSQAEYDAGPKYTVDLGSRIVDGKLMDMKWLVVHNWKTRIRFIRASLTVEGQESSYDYYSYMLTKDELIALCKKVGFSDVQQVTIPGEETYDVFLCYK